MSDEQLLEVIRSATDRITVLRGQQRDAVRRLLAGGMPERSLAARSGLSRTTIRKWADKHPS